MSPIKNLHRVYGTLLVGLVIIVVGAILINEISYQKQQENAVSSPTPTSVFTVTPSPTATSQSPSPTPQATVNSVSVQFPQSATTFMANFYSAYNAQDRARLATYFTPDTNDTDRSMHAHLFTDMDTNGTVGGPYLFVDGPANQRASGYTLVSETVQGSGWLVTVLEQRIDFQGAAQSPTTTIITLVPSTNPTGSWLVDSYVRTSGDEKYSAFLVE